MNEAILSKAFKHSLLFIIAGFCFNTFMLVPEYYCVFEKSFFIHTTLLKLQVSHLIFVLTNIALAITLRNKALVFLIHANSIGLIYSILMLPLCLINYINNIPPLLNDCYMAATFYVMLIQYKKMMRLSGLHAIKYLPVADAIAAFAFIAYLILG